MKIQISETKRIELYAIIFLTFITSFFFDLISGLWIDAKLMIFTLIKLSIILIGTVFYFFQKNKNVYVIKYAVIMMGIIATSLMKSLIEKTSFFQQIFDTNSFAGVFGSNVGLKLIGSLLIITLLLLLFRNREDAYLKLGDLSAKANKIGWLGIKENSISWGKLSIISGILISFGTIVLTLITVIGSLSFLKTEFFLKMFPVIIVLALVNSFSEGILFRNAVIAPLSKHMPKDIVILLSAFLFGSFHYIGAPGGIIGVVMSTVLGWFIARSVYETKGIFCGWLIHFMQDVVIFATVALLGSFVN